MALPKKGRYSKYIRPITILFDCMVITVLINVFYDDVWGLPSVYFSIYQLAGWLIVAYFTKFYEVYRYTSYLKILSKIITQGVVFLLVVVFFFPFAKTTLFSGKIIAQYLITAFIIITAFKLFMYFYLKRYRIATGSNYRNTIIVGYTPNAIQLREMFDQRQDYGYRFLGYFSDKKANADIKGRIDDIITFVEENEVDEIYCSLHEINNTKLKELVSYADTNAKTIKFIPDSKEIFSKNLTIDYYEFFPVLSLRVTPLHDPVAHFVKRVFDIIFSSLVIILILSWFGPLLAIIIRLESRGPALFKQSRAGLNEKEFFCYKFRSMKINDAKDAVTVKNDPRITNVGKFIRKTSIDELPQFFNVFLGDMSVVGPRPHIYSINDVYGTRIKKYMKRHSVKPGITGLAQVRGSRGEINADEDMINRIKYDMFYIENWSILLDIKIVIQTVVNVFKGDEKAF
jgi:putative colanic acid biosynthesis UDP-glucose lipid carrier transferase